MFKIGLIVNPIAGVGGRVGLKGSDGACVQTEALKRGAEKLAQHKAENGLRELLDLKSHIKILTVSGDMGQSLCTKLKFNYQVVYQAQEPTTAIETQQAVLAMQKYKPDLLLFAGGDGTARDIYNAVDETQVVLGIPAGVKIHSAVYAVSALAAGQLVKQILKGQLVNLTLADVVDLDEEAFRRGRVQAKAYGQMLIPESALYMQAVKQADPYHQEQNLEDIAAYIIEDMDDRFHYVIGSGTTCGAIMQQLGLDNTLLGSDIIFQGLVVQADANESDFLEYLREGKELRFVLTVIGGQGHLLGRGNHQISPAVIESATWANFIIIASEQKIKQLDRKPLRVDSGNRQLDRQLAGLQKVIIGYRNQILYPME